MKSRKTSKIWCIIIVISIFVIQELASKFGGVIANIFNYSSIDKDSVFAWISVHHIVQLLVVVSIILILSKLLKLDFKFKIGDIKIGMKYVISFTLVMLIYILASYIIGYYFNKISLYSYELNTRNIIGTLGFQLFLSGTSEEILFRALPITVFLYFFRDNKGFGIKRVNIPLEIVIAAFLFSISHISWSLNPFLISVDLFQLFYAFLLGIVYGFTYERSQSIIYPILMHSISNVLMVGIGYIFAIIL